MNKQSPELDADTVFIVVVMDMVAFIKVCMVEFFVVTWRQGPCVQDMYTRILSANLGFDSELQHVFCWAPGECHVSRVFHVDRVFLRLC